MPGQSHLQPIATSDADPFAPSVRRPVRVRARSLPVDAHFAPHSHPWAQLACCTHGVLQVTVQPRQPGEEGGGQDITYNVPPSRAVWIAPGAQHQVTVLQAAEFRTVYIAPDRTPAGWQGCRAMMVSPLLRETIAALDTAALPADTAREHLLGALLLDEMARADGQALGVPMPHPERGDKRLRALCEAVLRAPAAHATLADSADHAGASERTLARLFQAELGMGYQKWRQQAMLAHALPLLAQGQPVSWVAAASGYATASAFSAMFKAAMGQSPRSFQGK